MAMASESLQRLASGELKSGPRRGRYSDPPGTAAMIGQVLDSRQASIDKVRAKVADDPEKLWSIDSIVRLTRVAMDTKSKTMADKLVDDKLAELKLDEEVKNIFLGIVALLAVGTVVSAGISGYQAVQSIRKYQLEKALANTDLDKRAYALAAEEPSAFWVALDIVFAIADGATALQAFRSLKAEARTALMAAEGAEAIEAEGRLVKSADAIEGVEKSKLGQRLRDTLARLRGRPPGARTLGGVGKAEAGAVVHASEVIAKEAKSAETLVSIGGHEVKVTSSGHLVICTECTWLRERFARELAEKPEFLARLKSAEDKVQLAGKAVDGQTKAEIAALSQELQSARSGRTLTELGPEAAEALIKGHPQLAKDLEVAKALKGEAATEAMKNLITRRELVKEAEQMSLQDLEKLLDKPEHAIGTASGTDLRFVRHQKKGGTYAFAEWELKAKQIWENTRFGTLRERELKEAFDLGPKNQVKMLNPDPKKANFIPDHIEGNPAALEWGKPYHFVELKDWANMSDTGNLSAMLDYVENPKFSSQLTIYYKSNTYMSGPLRTRIEGLMKQGKVELIPFAGP
jgi:hypothetical protein